MDVVLVLSVRNFPSLELPPERHDVRALTREPVHAVRQPAFLYDVTAELEDVGDEAAALLEVLSQVNPEDSPTLELTVGHSGLFL